MSKRTCSILFLGADAAYLRKFRGPLMEAFASRGYRVVAVAGDGGDSESGAFRKLGARLIDWRLSKAGLNPLSEIGPVVRLWRILRREQPDILFAHTIKAVIYGLLLGWAAGVPRRTVMLPGLGYAFTDATGIRRRFVNAVARIGYRAALARAHMVIFQNTDDLETLRQQGVLSPTTPIGVVNGSGVDMTAFRPAPWPPGSPTFLMLARLLKDKGVYEFVEAARRVRRIHPDARFVLAGGTDLNPTAVPREQIDAWVDEGLIAAPGHITDPRALFETSHVFVLPSYYREGCPRVNLEAMAMARAVVTTDWVGCRNTVVDGVTGILVPPRDTDRLVDALLELAEDLPRARAMGEAGLRMCAERFELAAVTAATVELIQPGQQTGTASACTNS